MIKKYESVDQRKNHISNNGFNLYHSIKEYPSLRKYKWLDLSNLCKSFVGKNSEVKDIYYFTALATWDQNKEARHKIYIKALRYSGIKVIYGKFKKKDRVCRFCKKAYKSHEEKLTDVNIAIHLLKLAIHDEYDTAIIVSGDTDLIPAVEAVQAIYPGKKIGVIFPIGRTSHEMKSICDFHMKIKEKHIMNFQLPEEISDHDGVCMKKPSEWA